MPKLNRRKFIKGVVVAGAGACVCGLNGCATFTKTGNTPSVLSGAYAVENNKARIDLSKVPGLAVVGGSVKIVDPKFSPPVIVARNGETEYAVVSIKCPHRGVEVEYKHTDRQFRCASLGHSTFGVDGSFKKGFAKKPLTKFEASLDPLDNNILVISLS